jgi:hypothetical protein
VTVTGYLCRKLVRCIHSKFLSENNAEDG